MNRELLVLFDVGETLLRPVPSYEHHFVAACREAGVDVEPVRAKEAIERKLGRHVERVRRTPDGEFSTSYERSLYFWTQFYVEIFGELGLGDWPGELPRRLYERFSSFETYGWVDDARDAFQAVIAAGYRIGVVSNWEAWLPDLLDHLGISEHLTACAVSGVVGFEKPDLEIFRIALAQAGAEPVEAVMVGDSLEADVVPALQLGMAAVLLDRQGGCPDGDYVRIESLRELPGVLGPLSRR